MRVRDRALTRLLLSLGIVLLLVNARQRAVQHPSPLADLPSDAFSFSEPSKITTRHLSLDLTVDFAARRLSGTATLDIQNLTGTRTLILDTAGLTVMRVTRDGQPTNYSFGTTTDWGAPLRIEIEPATRSVTIDYSTNEAGGLLWNTAAQSYGRVQPYLYTQNEPIQARSWIPLQDTPTVRLTYDATIRVPQGLLALMSAGNNPREVEGSGVYTFAMEQSIPSYLIALAVGRLTYHPFDERTGVYAEPELIEDAAWELAYFPDMLAAAERILGPHPFPRHDVLLMPPTYIVGGMEHPMLNFINPFSVVTGNRPAVVEPRTLMAHELAHSWAGDATTLGSWNDVWLNEGITSYLTLRILEEIGYRELSELGFQIDRMNYQGFASTTQTPEVTTLHRTLPNPYSGFSITSYTKGSLFLRTLEDHLGRATLDRFLRDYFRSFSFRWVDDRNFVARLAATLGHAPDASLRFSEWLYGTGLPSNVTAPTSSAMYDRVTARVLAFNGGAAFSTLDPQSWSETELSLFLQRANQETLRSQLAEIDVALGLSMRQSPPTMWLTNALAAKYSPADAAVERVLMRGGGNGTMTAVYSALIAVNHTRAAEIFAIAKDRYHPNVAAVIQKWLEESNLWTAAA